MIKSVIASALMIQLSMTTKLEMARLFPEVASYRMAHPSEKVCESIPGQCATILGRSPDPSRRFGNEGFETAHIEG
jgi:hypothetical protein